MCTALENYFSLLNCKLDRVREAKSLTLVQFKLIEDKNYDELSNVLTKITSIMDNFHKCSDAMKQLEINAFSDEDKEKSEEINRQIEAVMAEIREDNVKLKKMLLDRKDACRDEIKELKQNERGTMGYINYGLAKGSRFFDKEG